MLIDFIFEIKLNKTRHIDNRLPHGKGKQPWKYGSSNDQRDVFKQDVFGFCEASSGVGQIPIDYGDWITNQTRRNNGKYLGSDRKNESEYKTCLILVKIFIKVL